ncbi:hypothetical protein D3C83_205870 [compost metagenome]
MPDGIGAEALDCGADGADEHGQQCLFAMPVILETVDRGVRKVDGHEILGRSPVHSQQRPQRSLVESNSGL